MRAYHFEDIFGAHSAEKKCDNRFDKGLKNELHFARCVWSHSWIKLHNGPSDDIIKGKGIIRRQHL